MVWCNCPKLAWPFSGTDVSHSKKGSDYIRLCVFVCTCLLLLNGDILFNSHAISLYLCVLS